MHVLRRQMVLGNLIQTLESLKNLDMLHLQLILRKTNGGKHLIKLAKMLLAKGADVNAKNRMGCTPLFEAVKSAKHNAIDFLLAQRNFFDDSGPHFGQVQSQGSRLFPPRSSMPQILTFCPIIHTERPRMKGGNLHSRRIIRTFGTRVNFLLMHMLPADPKR